ncbi:hypothetical protein BN59_02777 [Legionella massiliensis]|uniref:Uncharacterized protein n=1 Tax=Legionella massiliensis TaxID=1034943 RepID=A0A078KZR6_9GAMM|nr:hypothetical protein BN59_02777 [Legionella massiliensis]CEE14205.1 hypothetical protein BN1094_02777 [Legionella massiliensis]
MILILVGRMTHKYLHKKSKRHSSNENLDYAALHQGYTCVDTYGLDCGDSEVVEDIANKINLHAS